ncbi:MAG: hypothetical protein RIQ81_898 [Pseudomonadota bacterium]|jgi:V8-like Glu-specific endopeptidase
MAVFQSKIPFTFVVSFVLLCGSCRTTAHLPADPKGIYGEDGRKDVYEANLSSRARKLADATAIRVSESGVKLEKDGSFNLLPTTFRDLYKVCADERFASQPLVGNCSGFLIGPDLLATAGHCIRDLDFCKSKLWVFGFMLDEKDKDLSRAKAEDVYRCAEIKHLALRNPGVNNMDLAVIRLDRPVQGREPVALNGKEAAPGDRLLMMGYPTGLPLKVTGDERTVIRSPEQDDAGNQFWLSNLDGFVGNSGSPVFRAHDLSLVGVFVFGDKDFSADGDCRKSIRRGDDEGAGERIVPVSYLIPVSHAGCCQGSL